MGELTVRFLHGEKARCKLFIYIWVNIFECDDHILYNHVHWQPSSVVIVVETKHPWCYQLRGVHIHVKICRSYGFDKLQQIQLHLQCDRPVFEHRVLQICAGSFAGVFRGPRAWILVDIVNTLCGKKIESQRGRTYQSILFNLSH